LGTFAFTGLKMAGPDMRATGADFFNEKRPKIPVF
jgi:putative ABC transport system permease protein